MEDDEGRAEAGPAGAARRFSAPLAETCTLEAQEYEGETTHEKVGVGSAMPSSVPGVFEV